MLESNGTHYVNFCKAFIYYFSGCPSIVRSDHETENTTLAACHMALRHEHNERVFGLGLQQQIQLS